MSADTFLPDEMSNRQPADTGPAQSSGDASTPVVQKAGAETGSDADNLRGTDRDTACDESAYDEPDYDADYDEADEFGRPYRSLSKAAMFALVLTLVALPLMWLFVYADEAFYIVVPLPLIAIALGVSALFKIRRYPNELMGRIPALLAIGVSVVALVAGVATQRYIYAHEVPKGYDRITWYDLRPHGEERRFPLPLKAFELDGKRVFIKGYVHPSVSGTGPVKTFMLVGDMKTCCFGGMPKLVDRIDVLLEGNLSVQYSTRKRKLGGRLELNVDPRDPRTFFKPDDGSMGPYYVLHVDYLK